MHMCYDAESWTACAGSRLVSLTQAMSLVFCGQQLGWNYKMSISFSDMHMVFPLSPGCVPTEPLS
eukprot:9386930-Alexandrium_andersonii.AAC.1